MIIITIIIIIIERKSYKLNVITSESITKKTEQ